MKGVAGIKAEYLKVNLPIGDQTQSSVHNSDGLTRPNDDEVNPKKRKKGQNKARDHFHTKLNGAKKLCKAVVAGKNCSFGETCKFSHDVKEFLKSKPLDIANACYNYSQFGRCPYGFTCRFAKAHIQEVDGQVLNIVNEKFPVTSRSINSLNAENLNLLRKHKYNFCKALQATADAKKLVDELVKKNMQESNMKNIVKPNGEIPTNVTGVPEETDLLVNSHEPQNTPTAAESVRCDLQVSECKDSIEVGHIQNLDAIIIDGPNGNMEQLENKGNLHNESLGENHVIHELTSTKSNDGLTIGCITNEDLFVVKSGEKKKIDFNNKLYLAPLTTVGNLPFRRVCKTFGADITCGEMALASKLLQGIPSEWALVRRHSSEDFFGVQICGGYADSMAKCTQLINENCDVDFIDINCGCPIDLIFEQGMGSALLKRTNRLHEMVNAMVNVSSVPITVKIRTGISESKPTAHLLLDKMRSWGIAMSTLHGRSREQRYTKLADWEYIKQCAAAAAPLPLYGGGDIFSYEDYNEAMKTNVAGTMIARGALVKPWIFTEIKEQRHWDISSSERLDILRDYSNYGLEHWGSDDKGVETTRKFLLEWLSFLHRYVPVGLLERPPQKMNERPQPYFGRDDLETLMASGNSSDWVKISEMLLGPVPDGFFFIPKHKANSYNG